MKFCNIIFGTVSCVFTFLVVWLIFGHNFRVLYTIELLTAIVGYLLWTFETMFHRISFYMITIYSHALYAWIYSQTLLYRTRYNWLKTSRHPSIRGIKGKILIKVSVFGTLKSLRHNHCIRDIVVWDIEVQLYSNLVSNIK